MCYSSINATLDVTSKQLRTGQTTNLKYISKLLYQFLKSHVASFSSYSIQLQHHPRVRNWCAQHESMHPSLYPLTDFLNMKMNSLYTNATLEHTFGMWLNGRFSSWMCVTNLCDTIMSVWTITT